MHVTLSLVLHLIAGEEIQLTIELQEFDRLNEFENAVLEQLPYIGESSTFGCYIFQEDPAGQQGVYPSQAARPSYRAVRISPQTHGQEVSPHQLPFPSLIQDAARRVSAIKEAALTLLDIVQNNPLAGNSHAHQSGARACHSICTEMETLEDALGQIP